MAASLAADDSLAAIRAQAYAGLGRAAKAAGDSAAAARYFMSVAVLYDDTNLVPECLGEAALAFGQAGRTDEARRTAEELQKRYPQSAWAGKVAAALATNSAAATPPPPPAQEARP